MNNGYHGKQYKVGTGKKSHNGHGTECRKSRLDEKKGGWNVAAECRPADCCAAVTSSYSQMQGLVKWTTNNAFSTPCLLLSSPNRNLTKVYMCSTR